MTVLLQPQPLVLCTHSHTSHLTPVFSIISPPIDDIIACAGFAVLFVHFQIKIFTISKGAEQLARHPRFYPITDKIQMSVILPVKFYILAADGSTHNQGYICDCDFAVCIGFVNNINVFSTVVAVGNLPLCERRKGSTAAHKRSFELIVCAAIETD